MLQRVPLPKQGEQLPHPVKWVKAGAIMCVRCLGAPLIIQGHWQKDPPRTLPCWGEMCQFCAESPPLPEKQVAFIAGQCYVREEYKKHGVVDTSQFGPTACVLLPADQVKELSLRPEYGHDWRGLLIDLWHTSSARTSPILITLRERTDPTKWPPAWDLTVDLLHMWREHLPADPQWRRDLYVREPGMEG